MSDVKRISKTELLIWVVALEIFGALCALIGGDETGFYNSLVLPPLSPPSQLFPIMWGIIYALLGASAYLVFRVAPWSDKTTVCVFALQLALNLIWYILFFRLHLLKLSAVVLVALTIAVGVLIIEFYRRYKLAGLMNILYLVWCAFACYLNIGIAMLN